MLSVHVGRAGLGGRRDRAILFAAFAAVVGLGWVALVLWGASPYARYLSHGELEHGAGAAETGLFVGGWLLMTIAMMLPTTWPLLVTFQALVRRRTRPGRLVVLLALGYVVTWSIVGLLLHSADRLVHAAVDAVPWLGAHPGIIGAATILVAGIYQFAPLKYRCLEECRSPLGFVLNHWRGVRERREAFLLGVRHGLFCVGCCWSLMLLMFGVGVGSLAWMLGLGLVMAIEKNAPWGRSLSAPLGIVLVASGSALMLGAVLV